MTKRIILIFTLLLIVKNNIAQKFEWAKNFGGAGNDISNAVKVDKDGNFYLTGSFKNNATFDTINLKSNGGEDVFLIKYNSSGEIKWFVSAGGNGDATATSITIDSEGNVFISGHFNDTLSFGDKSITSMGKYDAFVAKYSALGEFIWLAQLGGNSSDYAYDIAIDNDKNIYVTGSFSESILFEDFEFNSNGMEDIFLAKYDSSGTLHWIKTIGGKKDDIGSSIAVDVFNNIYLIGEFTDSITSENKIFSGKGGKDILLTKYNSDGENQWMKAFGGSGNDGGYSISFLEQNKIAIAGNFRNSCDFGDTVFQSIGGSDIFFAVLDTNGKFIWIKKIGGPGNDDVNEITTDASGNIYSIGNFSEHLIFEEQKMFGNSGTDIFVAKYDSSGEIIWTKKAGGNNTDIGQNIDVAQTGDVYITGVFNGDTYFDKKELSSFGEKTYDGYIAKINSDENNFPCYCDYGKNILKWKPLGGLFGWNGFAYERKLDKKTSIQFELGYLGYEAANFYGKYISDSNDTSKVASLLRTNNFRAIFEYRKYFSESAPNGFYYTPFLMLKFGINKFVENTMNKIIPEKDLLEYQEKSVSLRPGFKLGYQKFFKIRIFGECLCLSWDLFAAPALKIGTTFNRKYTNPAPDKTDDAIIKRYPYYDSFEKEKSGFYFWYGLRFGFVF